MAPDALTEHPADLHAAVQQIVARGAIRTVFQPIVDLRSAQVIGVEALTRADGVFRNASELFGAAESCGLDEPLEALARRSALRHVRDRGSDCMLFLNNSPRLFTSPDFAERVREEAEGIGGLPLHRIALEVTEHTGQGSIDDISGSSLSLRELGFQVAIDDVGAGVSGLNQIMTLRPNWIKLDIDLVSDIDLDPLKQNLIRSFVHFAKLGNMNVVAEGIERDGELRTLIELGVSHGQGFYLARPGSLGRPLDVGVHDRIREIQRVREERSLHDPAMVRVAAVATPVVTAEHLEPVAAVRERLAAARHRAGVAVLDGRRFVGWVPRARLEDEAYRVEDDAMAPVLGRLVMADCPLIGADWTLAEAMEIAAARPEEQHALPMIVQSCGDVCGMLSLRSLLLAAAEAHRRAPSHVAPLTGLPSRLHADRWLVSRIRDGDPADIVFVDLRDFDAYNVAYGFERGDEMLVALVGLIKTRLVDVAGGASFFAHLGEDRFMLAFPNDARAELESLMRAFEEMHAQFFSSVDLATGTFGRPAPPEHEHGHPLTMLRVVYLPHALQSVIDPRELHFIAGRLRLRRPDENAAHRFDIIEDRRGRRCAG